LAAYPWRVRAAGANSSHPGSFSTKGYTRDSTTCGCVTFVPTVSPNGKLTALVVSGNCPGITWSRDRRQRPTGTVTTCCVPCMTSGKSMLKCLPYGAAHETRVPAMDRPSLLVEQFTRYSSVLPSCLSESPRSTGKIMPNWPRWELHTSCI